ncbi:MAG: hypothetical protein ACJ74Q_15650 [Pyrinomonadaceae bacterium]
MLSSNPHAHIRVCRSQRREHVFCSAVLAAVVVALSALMLLLGSNPYVTRFPPVTKAMTFFAFAAVAVMVALALFRLAADVWHALIATREMQYQTWGALSISQEVAS